MVGSAGRPRRAALAAVTILLVGSCGVQSDRSSAGDDSSPDPAVQPTGTLPGLTLPSGSGPMETVGEPRSCRAAGAPPAAPAVVPSTLPNGVAAPAPDATPAEPYRSVPTGVTLVPHPQPQTGVYKAGPPVTLCWGDAESMLGGLAACSLRTPDCDVRSRWMPGVLAGAGVPVTLSVGDIDALVSIRVESVASGSVVVDLVEQTGTPAFTAPPEPGDYLVGIDLAGRARTVSYVLFARLAASAPSYGGTAMTFPVNVAAMSTDPRGSAASAVTAIAAPPLPPPPTPPGGGIVPTTTR